MLQQFLNHIQRNQLGDTSTRTLLAVSGGLDSMVMLHLYHTAGFEIGVAHCNFQLRGKAANDDAMLVKETCAALNIPFYLNAFNTAEYALENGLSIQMAARELRYAWFEQLLDQHHYQYLATAHHLNDSMETVLLGWIHGGSLEAFCGIPVKNNRVVRPLLFASRESLSQYALASNVVWREDQSNQTDDYERNYIRHHVIPHLKELNPSLEQTVLRGFEKLGGDAELMFAGFEQWKNNFVTGTPSRIQVAKKGLDQNKHAPTILWRLLRLFGFNLDVCHDIVESIQAQSGKKFLSATHVLAIDRDTLVMTPLHSGAAETIIDADQKHATLRLWKLNIARKEQPVITSSPLEASLDQALLKFPLRWRKWRAGDAFYPLGSNHRKKLSDFLIDMKVAVPDKENVTVLESDGEIVWVVGYRIDHRFRITDQTRQAITFLLTS